MRRSFGKVSQRGYADFVDHTNLFQIEPGRSEDIPHLEAILEQSPEAASWSAKALAEVLSSHSSHFLLARQSKDMVGFIAGRRVGSEGEILNLAVVPRFRRQSAGKALVQQLLQIFANEGVADVFLEVRLSNADAIAFYRNLGFRQVGERPAYYLNPPESALILTLGLASSGSTVGTD
jgi:[ribosomal protein S18]-alanine N-acetyltransferase